MQQIKFFTGLLKGDFKNMALTSKEMDFCRFFAVCRNVREAAQKAGFLFPERTGLKMLAKKQILSEIERYGEVIKQSAEATDGLRRIAFGSVADVVKLIFSPELAEDAEKLDLFMISEIKLPKTGGVEVKFFDRIKALEALLKVSETGTDEGAAPFINAIFKGASAITNVSESESNEL